MGADRHESSKRGLSPKLGRKRRYAGPPKDDTWFWMPREMLNSVAFRALSGNAMKIVMRICEENLAHGGYHNGSLVVTHKQFADFGIREASVAIAIREAEFFGFIRVDRGMAYKGGHEPNIYRLTWIGDAADAPPTNEWKGISDVHVSAWKSEKRSKADLRKKVRARRASQKSAVVVALRA